MTMAAITFRLDRVLKTRLERFVEHSMRYKDMTKFIIDAIYEKLQREEEDVYRDYENFAA